MLMLVGSSIITLVYKHRPGVSLDAVFNEIYLKKYGLNGALPHEFSHTFELCSEITLRRAYLHVYTRIEADREAQKHRTQHTVTVSLCCGV